MPKKREKNSEEWYKGRIRELEKENRALKRQLREIEKKEHIFDENSQDDEIATDSEDTYPAARRLSQCGDCGKGLIEEYEIMGKVIGTCNICGFRKRLK